MISADDAMPALRPPARPSPANPSTGHGIHEYRAQDPEETDVAAHGPAGLTTAEVVYAVCRFAAPDELMDYGYRLHDNTRRS